MQKIIQISSVSDLKTAGISRFSAAVGIFDGVHAGHRTLLQKLVQTAKDMRNDPVVLTFSPHPREILTPGNAPALLIPPWKKAELLAECGVRAVVTIPFTKELASMEAETFLDSCLACSGMEALCVGSRFHCGAGGKGTTDVLAAYAEAHGLVFHAVPEFRIGEETVCSSAVRQASAAGDLEKVRRFSGREAALYGYVEHGHGIAGKKLAHPTANLHAEYGILPPAGVYAATVILDGMRRHSVVNIGVSPTFTGGTSNPPTRVEIHLLDYSGDLYGKSLALELNRFIRPEKRFPDPDSLKKQIFEDVKKIQEFFQHG